MIKAIETRYKGYRFRSRLEARWAVFFDAIGILWEYEKEGYDLGGAGKYLPDFWLTRTGRSFANESQSVWAEVKAAPLTATEEVKCRSLVRLTKTPCILLVGVPDFKAYQVIEYYGDEDGTVIDEVLLHSSRNRFWWAPSDTDLEVYVRDDAQYQDAVSAARSARFEHGETPR